MLLINIYATVYIKRHNIPTALVCLYILLRCHHFLYTFQWVEKPMCEFKMLSCKTGALSTDIFWTGRMYRFYRTIKVYLKKKKLKHFRRY